MREEGWGGPRPAALVGDAGGKCGEKARVISEGGDGEVEYESDLGVTQRVSADDVARCLARTKLDGAPMTAVAVPGGASDTWIVDIADGDLVELWSEARDALAGLRLYPVAVTRWGDPDWQQADVFSRFYYGRASDPAPAAVIARSEVLTVDKALHRFTLVDNWAKEHWGDVVAHHLALTRRYFDDAPDPDDLAEIPAGEELVLERRLLEWEEAMRPTRPPDVSESFSWYEPRPAEPVGLALIPSIAPGHAAAFLSFYGAEGDGKHEALTRLMGHWHERFGAQIVASWGTMLQFVAARPPATLDEAFELAAQHVRVAPCTTMLPGEGVRHLARHLWGGRKWFLHERP